MTYSRNVNGLRYCTGCNQWLPADATHFFVNRTGSDGLTTRCKDCLKSQVSNYESNNRGKRNKRIRQRYSKQPDRVIARIRKYQKAHPEIQQKREARKLNLPDNFSQQYWERVLEYFNSCCAYCGNQQGFWNRLCMEHFIPLRSSNCPGTVPSNIIPACKACNSSKGRKPPAEWLTQKFGARKAKQILTKIEQYFDTVRERETA